MDGYFYGFPPVADENSEILILGSMPGQESLNKQQYYGHTRNQFWKILFQLFDETLEDNYEKINDLNAFIKDHPKSKAVFFNGDRAYKDFKKYIGFGGLSKYRVYKVVIDKSC